MLYNIYYPYILLHIHISSCINMSLTFIYEHEEITNRLLDEHDI